MYYPESKDRHCIADLSLFWHYVENNFYYDGDHL